MSLLAFRRVVPTENVIWVSSKASGFSGTFRISAELSPRVRLVLGRHRLQVANSDQVVDRRREGEHPADPLQAAMPSLAHQPHRLEPTKDLFHPFALSLTDSVTSMSSRAPIDGAGSILLVLRHMRCH